MGIQSGDRFGQLVVLEKVTITAGLRKRVYYKCVCDCGNTTTTRADTIKRTMSCGCVGAQLTSTKKKKHGRSRTDDKVYRTWIGMKARCFNPKAANYYLYGAQGVTVHSSWVNSFDQFLKDVGEPPDASYTIDRFPDKFGNYEPGNVRWATAAEQIRNRRTTITMTIDGVTRSAAEWHQAGCPIAYSTLTDRIKQGWDHATALSMPPIPEGDRFTFIVPLPVP